jgi:hypothetical protein
MDQARCRASRVPHTMFPCLPGVFDPARSAAASPLRRPRWCLPRVRSASAPRSSPISGLYTLPAPSPVNAARAPLPKRAHDSGPVWLARPSLSETCTPSHRAGLSRHTRTPAVSRRQRRERSGRCWRSAPVPGSARALRLRTALALLRLRMNLLHPFGHRCQRVIRMVNPSCVK